MIFVLYSEDQNGSFLIILSPYCFLFTRDDSGMSGVSFRSVQHSLEDDIIKVLNIHKLISFGIIPNLVSKHKMRPCALQIEL